MKTFSLTGFAKFQTKKALTANPTMSLMVKYATLEIYKAAEETFGDKAKLQALASATVDRRSYLMSRGTTAIGGTDSPLLFTGKLRSSLEMMHEGMVGGVGSPDPIMQWQELGTAHIPPRPLLRIAAQGASASNWLIVRHFAAEMIGITGESRPMYAVGYAEGAGGIVASDKNLANQFTGARKKG